VLSFTLVVAIVRRTGELPDRGEGPFDVVSRDALIDGLARGGQVRELRVEEDQAGVPELQGRAVEFRERLHPTLGALAFGTAERRDHEVIEHVEDVVASSAGEGVREGEERRAAAMLRQPLDRLGARRIREARQGRHAAGRQTREIQAVDPQLAHLAHPLEGAHEAVDVAARRGSAKPVEPRLPLTVDIGDEQRVKLIAALGREGLAQLLPESGRGAIADGGDGSGEYRGSGEQDPHLVRLERVLTGVAALQAVDHEPQGP
jgi:hypothetical protein